MVTRFRLAEELGTKMSQASLALQSGVHIATVSRLFNNTTKTVRLETLDKLAVVLGCTPGDLLVQVQAKKRGKKK